jgi:hypothetical protein
MPTLKPYTLPSRSKSQPHEPKLVKEYVFANATNRTKNKVRKHNKVYKSLGNKWLNEIIDVNKIYGKLKMKCFEMPNASYTNRCATGKKNRNKTTLNTKNQFKCDFFTKFA